MVYGCAKNGILVNHCTGASPSRVKSVAHNSSMHRQDTRLTVHACCQLAAALSYAEDGVVARRERGVEEREQRTVRLVEKQRGISRRLEASLNR